jgi:hypothetical protein
LALDVTADADPRAGTLYFAATPPNGRPSSWSAGDWVRADKAGDVWHCVAHTHVLAGLAPGRWQMWARYVAGNGVEEFVRQVGEFDVT